MNEYLTLPPTWYVGTPATRSGGTGPSVPTGFTQQKVIELAEGVS